MEVGECKIISQKDKRKAIAAAYQHGKLTGKKFVQRKGGLEVWRES